MECIEEMGTYFVFEACVDLCHIRKAYVPGHNLPAADALSPSKHSEDDLVIGLLEEVGNLTLDGVRTASQ